MVFSPRFIPEIPATRTRGGRLASHAGELALFFDARRGLSVRRIEELLSEKLDARAWPLEPIDWFPHFERDITAFFEHQLWQREGMNLSPHEIAAMVPIVRMLAATERWITGIFTTTELPPGAQEEARDSNLSHVNGMLDIMDEHFDELLRLLGNIKAMRWLAGKIIGHDLLEFPWGDHGRSLVTSAHPDEAVRHERRKKDEEAAALELILERTRGGIYATTLDNTLREYETGKPKHYTLETAHRGDLTAFLVKLIDHVQGTEYGHKRIFPYYGELERTGWEAGAVRSESQIRFDAHIDDGLSEVESIVRKTLQLVASREREKLEIAIDVAVAIAGDLLTHLGWRRFGSAWTSTDVRVSLWGFIDERDGLMAIAAE